VYVRNLIKLAYILLQLFCCIYIKRVKRMLDNERMSLSMQQWSGLLLWFPLSAEAFLFPKHYLKPGLR